MQSLSALCTTDVISVAVLGERGREQSVIQLPIERIIKRYQWTSLFFTLCIYGLVPSQLCMCRHANYFTVTSRIVTITRYAKFYLIVHNVHRTMNDL